jgi:formylglycine-generating enzyme required for sulfatase activity
MSEKDTSRERPGVVSDVDRVRLERMFAQRARSGAYNDLAATLRSATRHVYAPDYHGIIGLRCARTP